MAVVLLCGLPGLAGAAGTAARDGAAGAAGERDARLAVAALDRCLPRLDPEADVGIARIEARCPGLAAALEAGGVAATLPADWRRPDGDLSAGGLRALRRLLVAPPSAVALRPAPDTAALAALVAASRGEAQAPPPWERLMRWLRARIEGASAGGRDGDDWGRWLEGRSPSARAWTLLGYLALSGLVAFLGWVVLAEWRAAGGLGPRARAAAAGGVPDGDEEPARLADVAPTERPAWLLRHLAHRLQRLERLPAARALTARELVAVARLDGEPDRDALRGIALAAERVRYGASAPCPEELESAIAAAGALLARLETPARAGGAAP